MAVIEIKNLKVKYSKNKPLLNNINLDINKGEIVSIVGLSGCGKTTLVSAINGVIPNNVKAHFEGSVLVEGNDISNLGITEIAQKIGTVYQDPDSQIVFSTCYAELAFALENFCVPTEQMKEIISSVSNYLNINNILNQNPNNLSGGQKQLVVLASILAMGVDTFIFDEAMAQVDKKGCELISEVIMNLKAQGKSVLMIEHNFDHLNLADRVYQIKDGTLIQFEGVLK